MGSVKSIFESALISELRLPGVITVESGTELGEVADLMCRRRFGCVPIVKEGALVGIFTERDWLKRVLAQDDISLDRPVDDFMTRGPFTLTEFDRIWSASELMGQKKIRHIPIVDKSGKLVSMLSVRDLLQFLAECFPEELLAHPPDPSTITLQAESG